MGFTYRNRNTGDVYHFVGRNPELDALPNWELQDDVEVSELTEDAALRAAAQIASIEDAAANRLDKTRAAAEGTVNAAVARETTSQAGVAVPTAAHGEPLTSSDQTPLLSPDKTRGGHAGVGGRDLVSRDELEARAQADLNNPPLTGVLGRAKQDQRSGATQIGDNPEEHRPAKKAAAKKAAPAADAK